MIPLIQKMINESTLTKKINQYAITPAGKKLIRSRIDDYRKTGKQLANGTRIAGKAEMTNLAKILSTITRKHLPASIARVGEALKDSEPVKTIGGGYEVIVRFSRDALHRDSLYEDRYEGIDNIVALLNNGYRASNYVYGWWDGHKPTGAATQRSSLDSDYAWIRSMKEREALHFMQDAMEEFNSLFGEKFNVTALLGSDYVK